MKIAFGCDHAGFRDKKKIVEFLMKDGHIVRDFGCFSQENCDYPDIGADVARAVSSGEFQRGVLLCGSGIGMTVVANKFPGIRAALCRDDVTAKLAQEHNAVNILCLAARFSSVEEMIRWTDIWLKTSVTVEERHLRRIEKISKLEQELRGKK